MISMPSFEILPPESAPQDMQSDFVVYSNSPSHNSNAGTPTSVRSNVISSLFESQKEEIQKTVANLIQENNVLKEKVKKNNTVLLDQLNTISLCSRQMVEYKKKHAAVLEEREQCIQKLQEENKELHSKIMQLEALKLASVKEEIEAEAKRQQESKELEKKVEELQKAVEKSAAELDLMQKQNAVLLKERKDLQELNCELLNEMVESNSQQVKETEEKPFATVFSDEESGYAIVLKEDIQKDNASSSSKDISREYWKLQLNYSAISDELEKEKCMVEDLKKILEAKEKEIECLTEKNKRKVEESLTSCANIGGGKRTSQMEEELQRSYSYASGGLDSKTLVEAEKTLKLVTDMQERVVNLLVAQEESQIVQNEQISTMKDITDRQHLEQIDILTAKLMNMEDMLEAEKERSEKLEKKLKEITENVEETELLKEQMEAYKADFDSEKQALEKAKAEIEWLKHEKNALEEKLEELEDSGSYNGHKSSRRRSLGLRHRHSGRKDKNKSSEHFEQDNTDKKDQDELKMQCPQCHMVFSNIESLQDHVELCLNDDIFCV